MSFEAWLFELTKITTFLQKMYAKMKMVYILFCSLITYAGHMSMVWFGSFRWYNFISCGNNIFKKIADSIEN
jgi:hypothetical protein